MSSSRNKNLRNWRNSGETDKCKRVVGSGTEGETTKKLKLCSMNSPSTSKATESASTQKKKKTFRLPPPPATPDSWTELPDSVLLKIFKFLAPQDVYKKPGDLYRVSLVCRNWNRISLSRSLWRITNVLKKRLRESQLSRIVSRCQPEQLCINNCKLDPRNLVLTGPMKPSVSMLPRLKYLIIDCVGMNVGDLNRLLSMCKKLRIVNLARMKINSKTMDLLAENRSLKILKIEWCHGVDRNSVIALVLSLRKLISLSVDFCAPFNLFDEAAVRRHLPPTVVSASFLGFNLTAYEINNQIWRQLYQEGQFLEYEDEGMDLPWL